MCVPCLWVGEVPMWWVWPPPWVLGVWLVLVLAAGGVAVRCCCGTLLCFALLYLCAACYRVLASFIVCFCRLCPAALRCVLCCLRVVRYAASAAQGRSPVGAEFG